MGARSTRAFQPVPVPLPEVAGWAPGLTVWYAPVAVRLVPCCSSLPHSCRTVNCGHLGRCVRRDRRYNNTAADTGPRPRFARALPPQVMAALGPARPPSRPASGAVQPATRGGGALRRGRVGSCDVPGGAVTSSSAGLPLPRCWLRLRRSTICSGDEPAVCVRRRRVPMFLLRCPAPWFHAGNLVLLA